MPWRVPTLSAVAFVAVITVLITTFDSSGGGASRHISGLKSQTEREVSALVDGIPQNGNILGHQTAPITLQVFGDLECATVKLFAVSLLPAIINNFVRRGVLRIQYRSMKTDTENPRVFLNQQAAALAAGKQDKMWNFIETFYYEQGPEYTGYVTDDYLRGIASQVSGMDIARWGAERHRSGLTKQVISDDSAARHLGFHDTPSFLIGTTGGRMTKLLGDQVDELPGRGGEMRRLRYPVSLISSEIVKDAISRLSRVSRGKLSNYQQGS